MIRDIPSTLRHSRTSLEPVCGHSFVAWTLSACCGGSRYEGDVGWLEDGGGCSVVSTEIVTHPLVFSLETHTLVSMTLHSLDVSLASGEGPAATGHQRAYGWHHPPREGLGSTSCSKA